MWGLNDDPAGHSKIAVQVPASGETCSSFQVMPPVAKTSGNDAQSSWPMWTYSSCDCCFIACSQALRIGRAEVISRDYILILVNARREKSNGHGFRPILGRLAGRLPHVSIPTCVEL